ncbi:MAG: CHAT domain-containing protein, partial [Candidatus Rhabdochlamydia sp.]
KPDPHSVFEGLFKLAIDDNHPLGHLHAQEIASLSLKADLVFMSACHLGRGNLKQEGSIGPIWSFLGSGAKSTIASYWPLPDGHTTVKMVDTFYRHYLGIGTPKLNKAKALQQAVLMAMKTERDKPRQWGSFFLSGLIE